MSDQGIEAAVEAARRRLELHFDTDGSGLTDERLASALQAALPHLQAHILSTFIERLEGEEAVEAVAKLMYRYEGTEAAEGGPWSGFHPEGQEGLRIGARMHIQAAIKAAREPEGGGS